MHSKALSPEQILLVSDGDIMLYNNFFGHQASDKFLCALQREIRWRQDSIALYGKTFKLPRLSAWHGDPGCCYTYSGIVLQSISWTDTLFCIKKNIEQALSSRFNSVLLNLYRTGQDSINWHSDDEKELGQDPLIASLSLGGTRQFDIKHKFDTTRKKISIQLQHGSLLVMRGNTQHYWKHRITKTRKPVPQRINLTFRTIVS